MAVRGSLGRARRVLFYLSRLFYGFLRVVFYFVVGVVGDFGYRLFEDGRRLFDGERRV